jgi:hypothetical protein
MRTGREGRKTMRGHEPHRRVQGSTRAFVWAALPALTLARRKRANHVAKRQETLLAHDGPESREEAFAELGCLPPSDADETPQAPAAPPAHTRMTA